MQTGIAHPVGSYANIDESQNKTEILTRIINGSFRRLTTAETMTTPTILCCYTREHTSVTCRPSVSPRRWSILMFFHWAPAICKVSDILLIFIENRRYAARQEQIKLWICVSGRRVKSTPRVIITKIDVKRVQVSQANRISNRITYRRRPRQTNVRQAVQTNTWKLALCDCLAVVIVRLAMHASQRSFDLSAVRNKNTRLNLTLAHVFHNFRKLRERKKGKQTTNYDAMRNRERVSNVYTPSD